VSVGEPLSGRYEEVGELFRVLASPGKPDRWADHLRQAQVEPVAGAGVESMRATIDTAAASRAAQLSR
jgi:hypothetical protein